MWVKLVGSLLLLLLCARALFISAVNHSSAPSTRRQDEARGLSLTGGLPEEGGGGGGPIGDEKGDIVSVSRKGGSGKGAYGGANVVHRPPNTSAAPSLVATPLFVQLLIFVSLGFNFIRT